MFFRALTFFRFPTTLDFDQLDALLAACALKPVGALELASRGFVPPFGRGATALSHRVGGAIWITIGGENKLLPDAVVNKVLDERLEAIYARDGRRPGGRARKRLKEDIVHELLPGAFVKPSRIDAIIDPDLGVIAVDTASRRAAESVIGEIRHALGSFPALPLNAGVAPRSVLTSWAAGGPLPDGMTLGDDCTLEDAAEGGGKVKCYRIDLASNEITEHLHAGRQATRLSLVLSDAVSFDLDESLVVHKLRLLDGAIDALESADADSLEAELEARFALMAGETHRLFRVLENAMQLSAVEG